MAQPETRGRGTAWRNRHGFFKGFPNIAGGRTCRSPCFDKISSRRRGRKRNERYTDWNAFSGKLHPFIRFRNIFGGWRAVQCLRRQTDCRLMLHLTAALVTPCLPAQCIVADRTTSSVLQDSCEWQPPAFLFECGQQSAKQPPAEHGTAHSNSQTAARQLLEHSFSYSSLFLCSPGTLLPQTRRRFRTEKKKVLFLSCKSCYTIREFPARAQSRREAVEGKLIQDKKRGGTK